MPNVLFEALPPVLGPPARVNATNAYNLSFASSDNSSTSYSLPSMVISIFLPLGNN